MIRRFLPLLVLLAVGIGLSIGSMGDGRVRELPFDRFEELLAEGEVARVTVSGNQIRGELRAPREGIQRFVTYQVDPELAERLRGAEVSYDAQPERGGFLQALIGILPLLLLLGFWIYLGRQAMGRASPLGQMSRSQARLLEGVQTNVRFDDVAGVEEAKEELQEVVSFLRSPESHGRLGARMPRGLLLVGPPGTGKTLLARAVAGEAGVPFFSISGSEFVELFVGMGAARVRDLFKQARERSPCIVFVDELDALGRARGSMGPGGNDEREQTLNQLLVELDGFEASTGIVVLAATNRPEVLDQALLRPGRFDRQVVVGRPDRAGREAILQVHLGRIRTAPGLDPARIAALTPGLSGADLAQVVNDAALLATRRDAAHVEESDFVSAVERVVAGLEKKNRIPSQREREIVAHHEMGHALVAMALDGADPVQKISIVPRGLGALGFTMQAPSEERLLATEEELESRLAVLLGGRTAERLSFGSVSTGAADDLSRASSLARDMATRFGMVPELGQVTFDRTGPSFLDPQSPGRPSCSEETSREIDRAVHRLVERAASTAEAVLKANRDLLQSGAERLLEKETLEAADLDDLASRIAPVEQAA